MGFLKTLGAGFFALVVTMGLLLIMNLLISRDLGEPEETEDRKITDIVMDAPDIETRYEVAKPDKPEDPEEPPPDIPDVEYDAPDLNPDAISLVAPSVTGDIKVGGIGGFATDGEYLPIVKVQPIYPSRALSRGIEGYVIVEFTVTKSGTVRDPTVVEADPQRVFDRAATKAALKFKYKPRVIDGEPVEVPGVRNKITFAIAD